MHAVTRGPKKAKSNQWFTTSFNKTAKGHQKKVLGVSIAPNRRWFLAQLVVKTTHLPASNVMETKIPWELKRKVKKLKGYKSTTYVEITSFWWSSKLNSSHTCADIHKHIHAPGLNWPWVQSVQPDTLTCSPGFGMALDQADLRLGTIQPAPLLSPHRKAPCTFTPRIHLKAPGHCRLPILLLVPRDVLTRSSLPGSSRAGESKTERVQIPSDLLSPLKGRLHKSSVSDERLNSETKQKSCCLEKGTGTVTENGCLSSSIKQMQVKFVFSLVVLFYTCTWVFLSLKKCLLCCLVEVVRKQSAVILN